MEVLCQHNARTFNAWKFSIFFMEDHVIFKGIFFSDFASFFLNSNQPPDPRNYVPMNVPIFMNPRKLGPTKINYFTVYLNHPYTCLHSVQSFNPNNIAELL